MRPQIVRGEAAKFAAFRRAHAALAASGTVTLELGLARQSLAFGICQPAFERVPELASLAQQAAHLRFTHGQALSSDLGL